MHHTLFLYFFAVFVRLRRENFYLPNLHLQLEKRLELTLF